MKKQIKKENMKKHQYILVIIILIILLIGMIYLLYSENKKHEDMINDLKPLLPYNYNSIVKDDDVNFDLDNMRLIIYNDGTYAKEQKINLSSEEDYSNQDEHILKVTESETYEDGLYLNLYLDNKFIDKLVFSECPKCGISEDDYKNNLNEINKEYEKENIMIDEPFAGTSVSFYIIRNEGFAILSDYNDNDVLNNDGFTKDRLTFYNKNGRIGDGYIVGDGGALSYNDISNLTFDGKTFNYWDLDCENKQGILKSLTLKDGKIIEKDVKKEHKIYSKTIEEANLYGYNYVCK